MQNGHYASCVLSECGQMVAHAHCSECVQGQGMTAGIVGAELLCKAVDARLSNAGQTLEQQKAALQGLPAAFQAQLAAFLDFPWMLSTGLDAA